MTRLSDTNRARSLLGKRGAFQGAFRWPWMASGMGTDDAHTPATNRSRHNAQRVVEKVGRSITNSETPHLVIDRQIERSLPAQIPANALHRILVRHPGPVLQQQHLRQQRRRDRRPPHPSGIAVREIGITHDPMTMLSQQRIERPLRQRAHHLSGIKHPDLSRLSREHAQRVINPPDRPATISGLF